MVRRKPEKSLVKRFQDNPSVNSSVPAWHYSKKDLGAVIFFCSNDTINECLTKLLFGLPASHSSYVKTIEPGLPLFLYNYDDRNLHGIYEATSHGQMNINPNAWTENGSDRTLFPAQVRVCIRKQCNFLSEEKYRNIIQKNYCKQPNSHLDINERHTARRFRLELDRKQTGQLLSLFESSPLTRSSARFYANASKQRSLCGALSDFDARHKEGDVKKLATEKACSKHDMESGLPAELPCSTGTWASLFKKKPDSDARCDDFDKKPLVSESNWVSVCLKASNMNSGPPEETPWWEKESGASWDEERRLSGITPFWEEGTGDSRVIPSSWEEIAGPSVDTACWDHEKSPTAASVTEKGNSDSEEGTEGAFDSCGTDKSLLEDEHSHKLPSTSEKYEELFMNPPGIQSVVYQLRQEVLEANRKTSVLEKKLVDSDILLQQLRHRVIMLESHLSDSSTTNVDAWKDSFSNELFTESFDELLSDHDEHVFIMGGYDGVSWLRTMDRYSPSTDIVKILEPMSSVRSSASAAVLNGLIYNFGGWNGGNLWYDTVDCYNPLSNKWISCPPLSEKKGCLAGASLHNRIFALGGGNGKDSLNIVEMFDPVLGRWIRTRSMLQKVRF
ncbi:hypothetical protein AQUCO_03000202v1 [Aquilegia coerulea]|uniref:DCD domain-containing protein n=1 Tax=Aquilegia coerulea TaxID=218851 RepID=A0A2G5D1S0_AQUCA|nr:hypothetical protein AQUCO_03000202v1 [Aquilegia coerulea]